jgi:hypothetical protein
VGAPKTGSVLKKFPRSCRTCNSTCTFCTHHRIDGLRDLGIPGWHTTIFPPYFVAGAVFSGFAMVNTLLIIMRKVSNLEAYITIQHIELMNIIIMITGSIVGVAYITEFSSRGTLSGVRTIRFP